MGKTKTKFIGETIDEPTKKSKKGKSGDNKKTRAPGLKGGQRVVTISADPIVDPTEPKPEEKAKSKAQKTRSKKYRDNLSKIDKTKLYKIPEAVSLVKEASYSKFDGTLELHLKVSKPKLTVQVELPHAAGKEKKVEVASDKTIKKLEEGKVDFDVLLATPEMMPKLVPFAKILGPRGLMPNPKTGTIIRDTKDANNFSSSKITIKPEKKAPLVHLVVGKVSQKDSESLENIEAIINAIGPRVILKAHLSATMSPSVKLEIG